MRATIDRWVLLVLLMLTLSLWSSRLVERASGGLFATSSPWPTVVLVASTGALGAEIALRVNATLARRVAVPMTMIGALIALIATTICGIGPREQTGVIAGVLIAGAFLTLRAIVHERQSRTSDFETTLADCTDGSSIEER